MTNRNTANSEFIETPLGILTARGTWFHTTSEQINRFAPGLLKKVPLEKLVRAGEDWVRSPDSLSLLLYLGFVFMLSPWITLVLALVFHLLWNQNKSAFVSRPLTGVLHVLNSDPVLMLAALVVLSWLGISGQYLALGIGVALYFLMKIGLFRKGVDKIYARTGDHRITLNDRVFKMIIVKYALHHHVPIDEIDRMDEKIRELVIRRGKH